MDAASLKQPDDEVETQKAPIKFVDAVGRRFSLPFHLCQTWKGMEALVKQAFAHVAVIGDNVHEGHYDLIAPDGEIILPAVWDHLIEPGWAITMVMWPRPEKPKMHTIGASRALNLPKPPDAKSIPQEQGTAGGMDSREGPRQSDTEPFPREQFVAEAKDFYRGLVMLEKQSIETQNLQSKRGE